MTIFLITTGCIFFLFEIERKTVDRFSFSWIKVLYDFVMNDDVGPWARVIRSHKTTVPNQRSSIKENYKQGWKSKKNKNGKNKSFIFVSIRIDQREKKSESKSSFSCVSARSSRSSENKTQLEFFSFFDQYLTNRKSKPIKKNDKNSKQSDRERFRYFSLSFLFSWKLEYEFSFRQSILGETLFCWWRFRSSFDNWWRLLFESSVSWRISFIFDLLWESMAFLDFKASDRSVRRILERGPSFGSRIKSIKTRIQDVWHGMLS